MIQNFLNAHSNRSRWSRCVRVLAAFVSAGRQKCFVSTLTCSRNGPKKKNGLRQFAFPLSGGICIIPYLTQKCMIRLSPIVKYSSLLPQMRMGLVSVPLWPFPRSGRLWIFGLGFCQILVFFILHEHLYSQLPNPNRNLPLYCTFVHMK